MTDTEQKPETLYVLRLWDMMDGWLTLTKPITKEEADAQWAEKTHNGTRNTCYANGDYYKVYPADTRMLVTPEFLGR